jgi:HAE1 family hydrophobic/amphiphilic exporter-1
MNLSELFIKRPVMTILVMLTITFFGILSYLALPVSSLPDVDFPTIEVSVSYPGADPKTIADTVVVPLEQQFTSIPSIQTISSTSYTGSATIVLQFTLDRSIDLASTDVQAAITAANPQLPKDLPYAPTYSKVNPTATPVLFLLVASPTLSFSDLYVYGYNVIAQRLSMVEGVAQVQTFGQAYAARLRVDPQKMAAWNIGINEVGNVIKQENVYLPVGVLYGEKNEMTLDVNGQMFKASEYNDVIIKNDQGAITRFRDIGYAIDSVQNDKFFVRYYTKDTDELLVGMAIRKQPNANTIKVINDVKSLLPQLELSLPGAVKLVTIYDQSEYINESVADVEMTFCIALLLVIIVIFVYLGKYIDTLIPALAIPISVVGTFIAMKFLGFTVDILSLLAITLSVGFLVDDAIVVLENVVRHIEMGVAPFQAALDGSKEISFTILSMTLSLGSVFIPLLFMGGIVGRILHEFAMTILVAILMSGFVSLTLTPLLCSRVLPPKSKEEKKTKLQRLSERLNQRILKIYAPSLEWALSHTKTVFGFGLFCIGVSIALFIKLPKDFIPGEDMGFIEVFTQMADGTSPFELGRVQAQLGHIFRNDPYVDKTVTIGPNSQDNQGIAYLRLVDIHERPSIIEVCKELNEKTKNIPGVQMFYKPLPLINLQVGTQTSKGDYQYAMIGLDEDKLFKYAQIMQAKIKAIKGITNVTSDLDITQPQLNIRIDRDKASLYNITATQIENALNLALADSNLSPINTPQNQYYAIMEFTPEFYSRPDKLHQLWITSSTGDSVPLTAISSMEEGLGPLTVNHLDALPSATISFNSELPLNIALQEIQGIAKDLLPPEISGHVQGSASIFKQSFADLNFLLLITFFVIYVILGILYEDFFPPLTVMSTLAPAAMGGLLTLLLFGETLSLYAFIGVIMLLGIVMKNGIIMIDFANERRTLEGKTPRDAIFQACMIRCRPILMTTFSALMGAVPIALGVGGMTAQSRKPVGMVIVGGLIVSQLLTLYLTPVTYIYVEKLHAYLKKITSRKSTDGDEKPKTLGTDGAG